LHDSQSFSGDILLASDTLANLTTSKGESATRRYWPSWNRPYYAKYGL